MGEINEVARQQAATETCFKFQKLNKDIHASLIQEGLTLSLNVFHYAITKGSYSLHGSDSYVKGNHRYLTVGHFSFKNTM